jgi:P4 family phage/plasmid primase-like protien
MDPTNPTPRDPDADLRAAIAKADALLAENAAFLRRQRTQPAASAQPPPNDATPPPSDAAFFSVGDRGEARDPAHAESTRAGDTARSAILRFFQLLGPAPREVRVLRKVGAPMLGVFDSAELAVEAILAADAAAETLGVYTTLNPTPRPVTNALALGRAGAGTNDTDIPEREWLLIDLDPIRCAQSGEPLSDQKVPATDTEHGLAIERAHGARAWLVQRGVPSGAIVLGDSGNGAAILVRVQLPNDDSSKQLVEQLIAVVGLWFADAHVKVDSTVANASRITRLLGTVNRKGAATDGRPHRRSRLLDVSAEITVCSRDVLEGIAALAAHRDAKPDDDDGAQPGGCFDLAAWITEHRLAADGPYEWAGGKNGKSRKWIVNPCPFNAAHTNRSAVVMQFASGAPDFMCHHDSCKGKRWHELRDLLEPGWRERISASATARARRDPHQTDLGNSERFVAQHDADLRHCRVWRRWFVWDGHRWAHDETDEYMRRAKQTVRAIYTAASALTDEGQRKKLIQHALASEGAQRLVAMATLAASAPGIAVAPRQFDRDPWLLNVANGVLDMRTKTLREPRRDDYITKLAPVAYDPKAECPAWLVFLKSIFAGDDALIRFVQRAVGYSLVGDTRERVLFLLHGGGKNGKSTLLVTLSEVLGDYAQDTHTDTLLVRKGDAIPNDLAALVNVRFVTASETEEGKRLAEALVKKITGDEPISARFMRGEWFNFKPEFKLWLATNHKPIIRGADDAIWDRIRLIPFNVRFVDPDSPNDTDAPPDAPRMDKTLRAKLLAEKPGILRWAVEGCVSWQRDGLGTPPAVKQATGEYREEMDHMRDFLDECCVRGDDLTIGTAELFARYLEWCRYARERALTRQAFAARLDKLGIGKLKANGERSRGVRCGITLREPAAVGFAS